MKAARVTEYGDSSKLRLEEAPTPEPKAGEALVKLARAGINFIDVYMRQGVYKTSHTYKNSPPFVPGMEGSGWVAKLGEGVSGLKAGDRVAWCLSLGSYAEYAAVPAWRLMKIPDAVDFEVATALQLQGCTAHYLSHSLFPLKPGHTCLVHAAAGGVGQILVQLAKLKGARVLATVGTREKAKIVEALGGEPIVYTETEFAPRVKEMTQGAGCDVVYDSVGQATFMHSLKCLKKRGTLALFGGASGAVKSIDPLDLAEAGSIFFTRPHMADYMNSAEVIAERARDMFGHVAAGRVKVTIDRVFPLADARTAHDTIESRGTRGKLLLKVAD